MAGMIGSLRPATRSQRPGVLAKLAEEIRELKAGSGKPIVAIGGAGFMRSLIATGLIDEYHLAIHPVALGSGLPIFTGLEIPLYLKLADVKAFPGGAVAYTYRT